MQDKGLCFLGISHYWVVIFIFVYRVLSLANPRNFLDNKINVNHMVKKHGFNMRVDNRLSIARDSGPLSQRSAITKVRGTHAEP